MGNESQWENQDVSTCKTSGSQWHHHVVGTEKRIWDSEQIRLVGGFVISVSLSTFEFCLYLGGLSLRFPSRGHWRRKGGLFH